MSQTTREVRGLQQHVVLDLIRRKWPILAFLGFADVLYGFEACGAYREGVPDFPFDHAVCLAAFTVLASGLLSPEKHPLLRCLPLSNVMRGKYIWFSHVLATVIVVAPLVAMSALTQSFVPSALQVALTTLLSALVVLAVTIHFSIRSRLIKRLAIVAKYCVSIVSILGSLYVNHWLYWRLHFPWFFLLLAPLTASALFWSYRRAHLIECFPWELAPADAEAATPTDQPSPAEAVPLTHARRKLFLTAFVVPPLACTVLILEILLLMRIWDLVSTGSLLLIAAIPCFFSFLQMTYLIYPSLRLLRSLPLSRTRLSGAVMAGGVGGTLLQALLVGLFTLLGGGQRLPGLPLNFLLLWMSAAAFLPFFMVFLGQWKTWWLCALLLYPSIILGAIFEDSKLVTGLSNLIALPSVPVTAAAGSAIAAFFLLRYALLRPRLDWRYAREAQEMAARGSAT